MLTMLLLDRLRASAPSRVVTVSSMAHAYGQIKWDDLTSEKSYKKLLVYSQSKLANVFFTRELGRRMQGSFSTLFLHFICHYYITLFFWHNMLLRLIVTFRTVRTVPVVFGKISCALYGSVFCIQPTVSRIYRMSYDRLSA